LDSRNISPRSFLNRYISGNGDNFINFSNVDFDNAFNAAIIETDDARRISLYKETQRIIAENAASVYIQDILGFVALRSGMFGGVLNHPLYVIDFSSIYRITSN
jgi:peptide/nickel transport system substrate-binding protein